MRFGWLHRVALAAMGAISAVEVSPPAAAQAARFITVAQGEDEFKADQALARSLGGLVEQPEKLSYEKVRDQVVAAERGTLARMTPYAFVTAELLGAELDLIATYKSRSTGDTIYNSYLVVRRADFPKEPALLDVLEMLRGRSRRGQPARFVFHDKLSTSSYFLPSLFFRAHSIFAQSPHMTAAAPSTEIINIIVGQSGQTSSALVKAVADGEAQFAAVWDGTKAKFDDEGDEGHAAFGSNVWFVQLPTNLPCDLLVATANLAQKTKEDVSRLVRRGLLLDSGGGQPPVWDIDKWVAWHDADARSARLALSILRRQSIAPLSPVVVQVEGGNDEETRAVHEAIRLAGTELVVMNESFTAPDITFDLDKIHDGAMRLKVKYLKFFDKDHREVTQSFEVSFLERSDLTRRIAALIHSKLHRIRPIWLYDDDEPTVLRDVPFEPSPDVKVPFQEVEWRDPERNDFIRIGDSSAGLRTADFNKFRLDRSAFLLPSEERLDFDPMGARAIRVLLMRPSPRGLLFRVLTIAIVAAWVAAAAGLVWDLRRLRSRLIPRNARTSLFAGSEAASLHAATPPAPADVVTNKS